MEKKELVDLFNRLFRAIDGKKRHRLSTGDAGDHYHRGYNAGLIGAEDAVAEVARQLGFGPEREPDAAAAP